MNNLVFNGNKKDFEEMLDELTEIYTDETCCEICGSARATDSGFCKKCDAEAQFIARALMTLSPATKKWAQENIDKLEEFLDV